jgi:hypothetical protein
MYRACLPVYVHILIYAIRRELKRCQSGCIEDVAVTLQLNQALWADNNKVLEELRNAARETKIELL